MPPFRIPRITSKPRPPKCSTVRIRDKVASMWVLASRALLGLLLVVMFQGWGALLQKLAGRQRGDCDSGDRGALGWAFVLAMGGGLNALHLLNRPVYFSLFAIGACRGAFDWRRRIQLRCVDEKWLAITVVAALLGAPLFLES